MRKPVPGRPWTARPNLVCAPIRQSFVVRERVTLLTWWADVTLVGDTAWRPLRLSGTTWGQKTSVSTQHTARHWTIVSRIAATSRVWNEGEVARGASPTPHPGCLEALQQRVWARVPFVKVSCFRKGLPLAVRYHPIMQRKGSERSNYVIRIIWLQRK